MAETFPINSATFPKGIPVTWGSATPILRHFRKYEEILKAAETHVCVKTGNPRDEDQELEDLFYKHSDWLEDEILSMPCVGVADFAVKVLVASRRGSLSIDWDTSGIVQDARALAGSAA